VCLLNFKRAKKNKSAVELVDLIECRSARRMKLCIVTAVTNGPIKQLIIRAMSERYTAECNGIRLSSSRHLRSVQAFLGLQAQLSLLAHLITTSSVRLNVVQRHNLTILYSQLLSNAHGVARRKGVHYGEHG
jgi:hypothetical protein